MNEPLPDKAQRQSLKNNHLEAFAQFAKLLAKYALLFSQALKKGGQANDVPALMIKYALAFGQNTIKAIEILMREHISTVLACTLCRPYYELAMRLLWAAREPYGWQRLQAYLATEDLKWAKEAVNMPEIAEHAQQVLARSQEVLSRTDPRGKSYSPAPGLQQILMDIEKRDISEGIRPVGGNIAAYEYTNIYRVICRPAHAHMQAISLHPASFWGPTVFAAGTATFALLRTVCYTSSEDLSKQIKDLDLHIATISKKCLSPGKKDPGN